MRYKVVPPVRSVAFLREASEQLPLVPGTVEDCCTRIRNGTDLRSRETAREYLTFLQALGLAAEADDGFHRVRDPPPDDALPDAFLAGVYGAREAVDAIAEPRSGAAVYEEIVEPLVPRWERHRQADWQATWRDRTGRLLGWAVAFGVAERDGNGRFRRTR